MKFDLQTMTCGHCVNAVTKAVKSADPDAKLEVDRSNHKVSVETQVDRETVVAALSAAGYRPGRVRRGSRASSNVLSLAVCFDSPVNDARNHLSCRRIES
jgi:copper chaperone